MTDPVRVKLSDLERAAKILGPYSAAALAPADVARRCNLGEDPAVYLAGHTYFVGPPLPNKGASDNV